MQLGSVADIYTLTPMQELMLMHSIGSGRSSSLSNLFRYRIEGTLDVERLRACFQRAVDRHDVLRTLFLWESLPHPVQVVRETASVAFSVHDMSVLSEAPQAEALAALERAQREQGFDLARPPLLRIALVRLAAAEYRLLLTRHHLILDLWSIEALFAEVFEDYLSADVDRPPTPAAQFRDYVAWLRELPLEPSRAYWRDAMSTLDHTSALFTDRATRSRWRVQGHPSAELVFDDSRALIEFARRQGLTVASVVQGALALLVAARSGVRDVVYGLTVAGRPSALRGVDQCLGSFINNVPVRHRIDGEMSVLEWLRAVQRANAARSAHEHLPADEIQRLCPIAPHRPLYDLLLLVQPASEGVNRYGELTVSELDGPFDTALPMTLAVTPRDGELRLCAVHDPELVTSTDAQLLLAELSRILSMLMSEPARDCTSIIGAISPTSAPARAAYAPADEPDFAASTGADQTVVEALLEIWREVLGIPDLGVDDDFFDSGGSSIQAAHVFMAIERRLGHNLPLSTLFAAGSVRKLAAVLGEEVPQGSSLVGLKPDGQRAAVFVIPGVGGNVAGLAPLARALDAEQPLYGLQSPGLDGQTAPLTRIEGIASAFIADVEPVADHPLALFGVCWGANVALEMAQQLTRAGRPPRLLVVMDPVIDEQPVQPRHALPRRPQLVDFALDRARLYARELRARDARARVSWFAEKGSRLMSKLRHRDLLSGNRVELQNRRVLAANMQAARSYHPSPYSGCVVALMTAGRDLVTDDDPRDEWIQTLCPQARVVSVAGADTGAALAQHADEVARQLTQALLGLDGGAGDDYDVSRSSSAS